MWLTIIIGGVLIWQSVPDNQALIEGRLTSYLIFPAVVYWFYFFLGAIKVHKQAARSAEAIDRVIKNGVYALVRHPIYSADLVLAWGIFFYFPTFKAVLTVGWLSLVLFIWMKLEEWALSQKFGFEYKKYKKETPILLPRFFKKIRTRLESLGFFTNNLANSRD